VLCTLLLALLVPFDSIASAVIVSSGPTTTLSTTSAGATGVTYSFGTYRVEAGQSLHTIELTFPAGTDLSSAALVQPAGTMTVSGTSIVIAVSPQLGPGSDITVTIGGVTNTTTLGTYPANPSQHMTFIYDRTGGGPPRVRLPIGDYTITVAPVISITVSSTDIDFGTLLPGEVPPAVPIQVTVVSNVPCEVTRTVVGDAADLGLTITGDVVGAKPAGSATYSDSVQVAPTWYTPAETTLTATIVYTVLP
jgi:hypothetical protein